MRLTEVLNLKRNSSSHDPYFSQGQFISDIRYVEEHDPDWLKITLRDASYTVEKRLLVGEDLTSGPLRDALLGELYGFLKDDDRD